MLIPLLIENFIDYLKFFVDKKRYYNMKGEIFEGICYKVLSNLENKNSIIKGNLFKKQNEVDFLIFNKDYKIIYLIECTDYALLYFSFIEEKKREIETKTLEQLTIKKDYLFKNYLIKNKKIFANILGVKIQNLFDLKIKLVGITRIKCNDIDKIKFYTLSEISDNQKKKFS